jgi:hypothetical protein
VQSYIEGAKKWQIINENSVFLAILSTMLVQREQPVSPGSNGKNEGELPGGINTQRPDEFL